MDSSLPPFTLSDFSTHRCTTPIQPFDHMGNTSYNLGMRIWNLGPDDPLCLTMAADSRLTDLDYANDQIWELQLGRGTPAAILLNTTYGLRARHMRIFPQFTELHKVFERSGAVHRAAARA